MEIGAKLAGILVLVLLAGALLWGIEKAFLVGDTVIERKIFEESYQRQEADRSQIATYQAQLANIEVWLSDPNLDPAIRKKLEAQRAAILVRLSAVRGN